MLNEPLHIHTSHQNNTFHYDFHFFFQMNLNFHFHGNLKKMIIMNSIWCKINQWKERKVRPTWKTEKLVESLCFQITKLKQSLLFQSFLSDFSLSLSENEMIFQKINFLIEMRSLTIKVFEKLIFLQFYGVWLTVCVYVLMKEPCIYTSTRLPHIRLRMVLITVSNTPLPNPINNHVKTYKTLSNVTSDK